MRFVAEGWQKVLAVLEPGRRSPWFRTRSVSFETPRFDWLVLLPRPAVESPVVVVLGPIEQSDRARIAHHFGVEEVADRFTGRSIDVLVSIDQPAREVKDVLGELSSDGIAYVAGRRRVRFGLVSRAVDATAQPIRVVSAHWLVPDAATPRCFIPLDDPAPLRWYLRNLFGKGTLCRRLAARSLGVIARSAEWFAPHQAFVLAGSASAATSPDLLASVGGTDGAASGDRVFVLTSGHDAGSRTVVLPFDATDDVPTRAIKLAGHPSMNDLTEREQRALVELRSELPAEFARTVPAPMGRFEWRGRVGGIESVFDGPTLAVVLDEESSVPRRIEVMQEVASWLLELHRATADETEWDRRMHNDWMVSTIREAETSLAGAGSLAPFFGRLEAASAELIGGTIPTVRRHFDLGPWNIIKPAVGLGVIDWEYGLARSTRGRGLPLCDLDYFVKYWLHAVCGARSLRDELRLFVWFDGERDEAEVVGVFRRAARAVLDAHRHSIGLDPGFVPVLVAHHWIEHAVNTSVRQVATGDGRTRTVSAEEYLRVLADGLDFGPVAGSQPFGE